LIGANTSFAEREHPRIASLMCASIDEVVVWAKVVADADGSAAFRQVPGLIREDQVLINLVRTSRGNGEIRGRYEDTCRQARAHVGGE